MISIVVPTYNTAELTLRCCEAVIAAAPGAELIVVDDASIDGTAERLPPSVRVIRLEQNSGFAKAANAGVNAATGEIILLLNSDAVLDREALRGFVEAFSITPKLGVAGATLLNADGTPQWSGGRAPTLPWLIGVVSGAGRFARFFRRRRRPAAIREVDWVSGAAMAFRREVWRDCGPLSGQFRFYAQDLDFCMRARRAGWLIGVIDGARVVHDRGASIAGGSELHHDPELLWRDLLTWYASEHGTRRATFARRVLVVFGAMRVALTRRSDPARAAFVRATRALAQSDW